MVPGAVPGAPTGAGDRRHLDARARAATATARSRSRPGQFSMLYAFGVGEVPISVSGDPDRPGAARAHRPRGRRGHARRICAAEPGARARRARAVRQRAGRSARPQGGDVVIVAGGIGLAPLRPAIYAAARASASATAGSSLLYGGRAPDRPALPRRARALARARRSRSTSPSTRAGRGWRGRRRRRHDADRPRATSTPRSAVALICGPEVMMRFTVARAARPRRAAGARSTSRWSAT